MTTRIKRTVRSRTSSAALALGAALTASATALSVALMPSAGADLGSHWLNIASGVDVSGHQHMTTAGINWQAVRADGQNFAFVKATEGEGWVNEFYARDVAQAREVGLMVGMYHYARPAKDPIAQARHFSDRINEVGGLDLAPVLDLEVAEGLSPDQLAQWTRTFLQEVQLRTGRQPIVYTYRYFWIEQMANTTEFSEYPLWLAAYQAVSPTPVGGWSQLDFWQRSDAGRVNGITGPVDMNLFNGDFGQLLRYAAGDRSAAGGKLINVEVTEGVNLGADAVLLVGAITAVAASLAATPLLAQAAADSGFDGAAVDSFVALVVDLIQHNALPLPQLQQLADGGHSVGDLAILLDNAAHLAQLQPPASVVELNLPPLPTTIPAEVMAQLPPQLVDQVPEHLRPQEHLPAPGVVDLPAAPPQP